MKVKDLNLGDVLIALPGNFTVTGSKDKTKRQASFKVKIIRLFDDYAIGEFLGNYVYFDGNEIILNDTELQKFVLYKSVEPNKQETYTKNVIKIIENSVEYYVSFYKETYIDKFYNWYCTWKGRDGRMDNKIHYKEVVETKETDLTNKVKKTTKK